MSLREKLDEIKEQSAEEMPDHALQVSQRATEELKESGQAEEAVGEGDRAPAFSLPDTEGTTVSSEELLENGPLVLAFYRGVW